MRPHHLIVLTALALITAIAHAQSDTGFTYQGFLNDAGVPANGMYDMNFRLYDSDQFSGSQIGDLVDAAGVTVTEGRFTVPLDFGAGAFDGSERWLEIEVEFHLMWPRTPITPAPYAVQTRGIHVDDGENVGIGTTEPQHELDIEGLAPVVRLTATDPQITAHPSLAFKGSAGSPFFQSMGAIDFFDEADTHRATISANKSGPTAASISLSATPAETPQLSVFSTTARVGGGLQLQRRSDLTITGELNTDGSDSYLLLDGGDLGIGTDTPTARLHVEGNGYFSEPLFVTTNTGAYAVWGVSYVEGGFFQSIGVYGQSIPTTGPSSGVYGQTASDEGSGVTGWAESETGATHGVRGISDSPSGTGVFGYTRSAVGSTHAVEGSAMSGWDFYASGPAADYGSSSSIRWKHNVEPIADPLGRLARIRGVTFDWDAEHGGHRDVGMIAEEVGAVLPEVVQYEDNGIDAIGMDYARVSALLVEAVNALRAEKNGQIDALMLENLRLRDQMATLRSTIESMRSLSEQK